jgi:23S rRNA (uracil1939-C5)-methyltransferase
MPAVGDRILARIGTLTPEWDGIGTLEGGHEVRVPGVWPGDIVECALLARSRQHGHWFGRVMRVVAGGVFREPEACPVREACGGCPGLGIPYEAQVTWKREFLTARFPGAGFVPAPAPLGWRDKVKWIVGTAGDGRTAVGFWRHGTHRFLPVPVCAQLAPPLVRLAADLPGILEGIPAYDEATGEGLLRAVLAKCVSSGEVLVTFVVAARPDPEIEGRLAGALALDGVAGVTCNLHPGRGNRLTGEEEWTLAGANCLHETDHPRGFFVNASGFSQAHHVMARAAMEAIVSALDPPDAGRPVLELFCGAGPIGLALAAGGHPVTGVELDAGAIARARRAAPELAWHVADVNRLAALPIPDGPFHLIVNPPRAGLSDTLVNWIGRQPVRRLVYMSCNPRTLARDADPLAKYYFTLDNVIGFDMFPQTPWFETVATFSRQE